VLLLDSARRDRLTISPRRAAFYCGAVASLDEALRARGAALVVRRGAAAATVKRLARQARARTVVWAAEYDAAAVGRQRALQAELEEAGLRALIVHDAPVVQPEDLAAARSADGGEGYRAFVPYVNAWKEAVRAPFDTRVGLDTAGLESEALPTAAEFGAEALANAGSEARDARSGTADASSEASDAPPASAGARSEAAAPSETLAMAELEAFIAGPVLHYLTARYVPAEATSCLSAHLSFGTLSARTVLARIDARGRDRFLLTEERLSLEAFRRSLALRDFFLQLAWYFEAQPDQALQERMRHFPFAPEHPALAAWKAGRTGYPLVDAGIRELIATGRMHPRARAVAASFLCFDLGVDWRAGRDAWDRLLIEDEPALAGGNWQWIAGVGADLAQFPRIYNPRKQARTLDPRATYVRRWIPELAALPGAPGARARAGDGQLALPLFSAAVYPAPVVDHEEAAREYLRRYVEFVATPR
jgi:deoxyribodipyrimidine photo-lyase